MFGKKGNAAIYMIENKGIRNPKNLKQNERNKTLSH
jgi:hypothetical protein